jgi:hypothetical protein
VFRFLGVAFFIVSGIFLPGGSGIFSFFGTFRAIQAQGNLRAGFTPATAFGGDHQFQRPGLALGRNAAEGQGGGIENQP